MRTLPLLVLLALLVFLDACTAAPASEPPPAPPEIVAPPEVAITPPAAQVPLVVRHFDQARARELTVVMQPDATAGQISAIRSADHAARAALTAMGRQGAHVTALMLHEARAAVRALEASLDP